MPDPALLSAVADRLAVAYPAERDVADWERRHRAGLVPGRWPYGLAALAVDGVEVRPVSLPQQTRVGRALSRGGEMVQSRTGGTRQRSSEVLLTWDESTAVRAVGGRTKQDHCSGVIWLTDRPAGRTADAVRRALRGCRALWTLSSAQVEPLQRIMGPSGPSVSAIRFGVDHDFFSTHPYPARPLVVSVGGDRDRDPRTLFAALEEVHRARPEVEIVVQSKAGLPVPDGVSVVPHLSHVELRDLYRRMSVMVIATGHNLHVSGMTVSLEARAVGRPVVITGSPGMEDYVGTDDSVVVGTGDAAALAEGVVTLLDDVTLAESMGAAGRRNVVARHTEGRMCAELLDVVRG